MRWCLPPMRLRRLQRAAGVARWAWGAAGGVAAAAGAVAAATAGAVVAAVVAGALAAPSEAARAK